LEQFFGKGVNFKVIKVGLNSFMEIEKGEDSRQSSVQLEF
jgi:hypothetical protein